LLMSKACDEYLADKQEKVSLLSAVDYTHGFVRKV
jgi:hypothetical protein